MNYATVLDNSRKITLLKSWISYIRRWGEVANNEVRKKRFLIWWLEICRSAFSFRNAHTQLHYSSAANREIYDNLYQSGCEDNQDCLENCRLGKLSNSNVVYFHFNYKIYLHINTFKSKL